MSLAIFDLDNTLIRGDSDHGWGEFLIDRGHVDGDAYRALNDQFYAQYQSGNFDIYAYLEFALKPLSQFSPEALQQLHADFMRERIEPIVLPAAEALVQHHREAGHTLMIITATNRFVTGPIAERFGIEYLLASEAEQINGRYTGKSTGTPCFAEGKVERLNQWLSEHNETLDGSYFYSDSANDLPLLERVSHPFAVDPCPRLEKIAIDREWPIISLRDEEEPQ